MKLGKKQMFKLFRDATKDDEIKDYPGSEKGPLPQDDPKHFLEWYRDNLPPKVDAVVKVREYFENALGTHPAQHQAKPSFHPKRAEQPR